jgi:hypothetical protein
MRTFAALASTIVLVASLTNSCSSSPGVGTSCKTDSDCGSFTCYCVFGDPKVPNNYVPGVCSERCSSKADCAHLGSNMSCAKDMCTGINVCLPNFSGDELP